MENGFVPVFSSLLGLGDPNSGWAAGTPVTRAATEYIRLSKNSRMGLSPAPRSIIRLANLILTADSRANSLIIMDLMPPLNLVNQIAAACGLLWERPEPTQANREGQENANDRLQIGFSTRDGSSVVSDCGKMAREYAPAGST